MNSPRSPRSPRPQRKPSALLGLVPVAVLVALIAGVLRHFGSDALNGASQVALLLSAGVAVVLAMAFCRVPWAAIEGAVADNLRNVSLAIVILLLIGAISGSWMVSGIVPTMIVYGLKVISPRIYLFAACLICALVSVITGSSWTTIATIGVALLSIGQALGFSAPWCAGAIISGAYFGDKISPMSDTTVLSSSMSGVRLFDHIRYLLITTGPAFGIALAAYLAVSLCHPAAGAAGAEEVESVLRASFTISPWLLLVPVAVGVMIWRRVPAILLLLSASVMAAVAALIAQPQLVAAIGGSASLSFASGFKGVAVMLANSTAIPTASPAVSQLVSTSGIMGMMPTVFLIICAATFGGTLVGSGMIQAVTDALARRVKNRVSLVASTLATGIFSNLVMGDQYLSIILTSRLYNDMYRRLGFEERLLSRSVEDSATITSVLIPWNSCGMTQATVLRVSTAAYLPFCFFNLLSPLVSLVVAALGYKIKRSEPPRGSLVSRASAAP